MRERNFYNYKNAVGAKGVAIGEDSHKSYSHKGYSYKTATGLIENIIAKKEKELSLFSDEEAGGPVAVTSASRSYIDRAGKRVNLTPVQMKLVTAFAQVVDTILGEEKNKKYIEALPGEIDNSPRDKEGYIRRPQGSIGCPVDILKLAKLVYSADRIGGKQTGKVKEEVKKLSEIRQEFVYRDESGKIFAKRRAALISIPDEIDLYHDGEQKNIWYIRFEDVFVYDINSRYSLSPITLLQLWNATGVQTELFTMLLFLLQSVRGSFITHANNIVADREKELRKAKKDKEEIKKVLAALKESSLTYREGVTSILERLDTNKYKDKGKYINYTKLNKDLKQAADALLSMGIISKYYESTGSTGGRICNFVINDDWIVDESNKIKASLPPGGDLKGE